jgi:hypothetical protein
MDGQAGADGKNVLAWMLDVLDSPLLRYLLNCDSVEAQVDR